MLEKRVVIRFHTFSRDCTNEQKITDEYLYVWGEVTQVLSDIHYVLAQYDINVFINWSEHIDLIQAYIRNQTNIVGYSDNLPEYIDLDCLLVTNYEDDDLKISNRMIHYYIETVFLHIFIVMNLSAPGVFNPKMVREKTNFEDDMDFALYELSAYNFEVSWVDSIRNDEWPTIERIPLDVVWNWFNTLNIGTRQIAYTRLERAIFALLNNCKESIISPNSIIWLSQALEALYDTPTAQINKILVDRIILFLEIPEEKQKKIGKKIRGFYDLRSRYVHGEMDIHLPTVNDILDDKLNDYFENLYEYHYFAYAIILATIQKMIKNGWTTIHFYEAYTGS